jgi:hypothetical protein
MSTKIKPNKEEKKQKLILGVAASNKYRCRGIPRGDIT